jgi:hypothetical protein
VSVVAANTHMRDTLVVLETRIDSLRARRISKIQLVVFLYDTKTDAIAAR